ncbi:MAG TPA: YXWGXW repeat-containing protein [Steroidobacteraceae bacterium]|jgi:hypothetical protein
MRHAKILALIPVLILGTASALSQAAVDVRVSVNLAPPPIPVYDQPPLPAPGYLWTPGYWAWDGMDYYWVPGTWVLPPGDGMLWTPGYWDWDSDGEYVWNDGYWAPEVGFYGGIDYGYGYGGSGFEGGYWHGGAFFYNRSVANFGRVNIVNVYTAPARHWGSSHVSFNGGQGGVHARPSAHDRIAMNARHSGLTSAQRDHREHAQGMRELHASQNGGRPQILTTARAADFAHPGPGLHNHATPRPSGEAPRASGGAPQFRGGQGAQVEHHEAQPGRGARPEEGAGQRFQPHEQVQQPRQQAQPHEQIQPHEQVQPHNHEPVRPPQVTHEQPPPRHEQMPRPQPQAQPQGGHEQGPRPEGQHEAPKDRRDNGDHRDH